MSATSYSAKEKVIFSVSIPCKQLEILTGGSLPKTVVCLIISAFLNFFAGSGLCGFGLDYDLN